MAKEGAPIPHNPKTFRRFGMLGLASIPFGFAAMTATAAFGIAEGNDHNSKYIIAAFALEAGIAGAAAAISVVGMDEELRRKEAEKQAREAEQNSKLPLPDPSKDIR